MTDETAAPEAPQADSKLETFALVIAVAGWIVPGLGHALLKMWGRALACFLTVGLLVFFGAAMRGNVSLRMQMMRSTRSVIWRISAREPFISSRGLWKLTARTFLGRTVTTERASSRQRAC